MGRVERWLNPVADGLRPHMVVIVPALFGALALLFFTWLSGEVYEAVTEGRGVSVLDRPVLDFAISLRSPRLDGVVTAFTSVGGPLVTPIIAGGIVVWLCFHWRSLLPLTLMVAATLGSLATTIVGKNYVHRVRPDHHLAVPPYEFSPSFPSGHSLNSVVVSGVLAYLLLRRLERRSARIAVVVAAVLYSLLMGLSRVYLGHHWLTDVITGWALGLAWLAVVIGVHRVALAVKSRPAPPAPIEQATAPHPADD